MIRNSVSRDLLMATLVMVDIATHNQTPDAESHGVVTWDAPIYGTFHDWLGGA